MTKLFFFLLIITSLIHIGGKAQSNDLFFDLTSGGGRLTPHHPELRNLAGPVSFINARLGLKTFGKKEWQRIYHYPEIGIGFSHNYLTSKSLGNPTAVYSFMNLPLLPDKKFKLNGGIHLGFAWGFNPSTNQNQVNLAIGSKCTAYFSVNLNSQFRISQNFDLLLSAGAYHYSNGNMMKPNKGINLLGSETGIRYTVRNSDKIRNTDPVSPIEKSSSVIVFGSCGWKKEVTYASGFPIGSLSSGYYKTISHKSRLSTGFDLFLDEDALYFTQQENTHNQ